MEEWRGSESGMEDAESMWLVMINTPNRKKSTRKKMKNMICKIKKLKKFYSIKFREEKAVEQELEMRVSHPYLYMRSLLYFRKKS